MKTIDLHGIRHEEVTDIIIAACSTMNIPFVVITGKSDRMKRIVKFAAEKFSLSVRDAVDNPGRVIVEDS